MSITVRVIAAYMASLQVPAETAEMRPITLSPDDSSLIIIPAFSAPQFERPLLLQPGPVVQLSLENREDLIDRQ
jgi:hypothetical protein